MPLLVAVADSVFPNLDTARELLSAVPAELKLSEQATPEEILRVAAPADALLVTYAKITGDDLDAATAAGIVVTKVPDYCIDEVSDHAMALLLALVRKIPASNAQVHAGRWEMKAVVPIHRLRGRVLGLVGFGRIPQLVAPKAKAFGLRVIVYDPFVPADVLARERVDQVDFDELLAESDYVSIHTPLLPETRNLFSTEAFGRMKPGAYLINTARGPIVDDQALAKALDAGQLAGAALDVMPTEPPVGSPLLGRENVIITPHTSFYSEESLLELQRKAAQEVADVLSGKPPKNPVNPQALERKLKA
jgi:D-3-phosphoglycerate dehydrogenase